MAINVVTLDDLERFRELLLNDIRNLLKSNQGNIGPAEWLRGCEVRKLLKISATTVQNLRISGVLKPVKIGGTWFYKYDDISKLFDKNF